MECMDRTGQWYRDVIEFRIPERSGKLHVPYGIPVITSNRFNTTNLHVYIQCHNDRKMYFPGAKYKLPGNETFTFFVNQKDVPRLTIGPIESPFKNWRFAWK